MASVLSCILVSLVHQDLEGYTTQGVPLLLHLGEDHGEQFEIATENPEVVAKLWFCVRAVLYTLLVPNP